jgi:hypothetical protein
VPHQAAEPSAAGAPIYGPEVVARVIAWAAHQRRREVNVGANTIKAIVGQKFIPGILDRYLARLPDSADQLAHRTRTPR